MSTTLERSAAPGHARTAAASMPALRPALRRAILALIVLSSATAAIAAMRRTSTTFDEIVFIAGGARGFETGKFDLAPDHPPLMEYLYGLPAYLSHPNYPPERPGLWNSDTRYGYARGFFARVGNDAERLAFRSRLVAVAIAAALVVLVYAFTLQGFGALPALLAAALVAFLPDVLAHGGVAYSDVPVAAAFLGALWAIDAAVRRPGVWRGILAGGAVAVALGIKFSAVLLAPAAVLLVLAELVRRGADGRWGRRVAGCAGVAFVALYLTLALIYRGDWTLSHLIAGIRLQLAHVAAPGGAPNYLLGRMDPRGWWYFYPVAFLFKTSAALHLLMAVALAGLAGVSVRGRALLGSRLRVPVLGGVVFLWALLTSHLDIGFRYALPLLPLLCILVAVGVARVWERSGRRVRAAIAGLMIWYVAAPLTAYPWFLSYISEYGPPPERAYTVLVDSSIDWGQGLLALRDYMRQHDIPSVYLGYFGSAEPSAYGITYAPFASFFPLPEPTRPVTPKPRYVALSATMLTGDYLDRDRFAVLRHVRPVAVLGGSIYLYRLGQ